MLRKLTGKRSRTVRTILNERTAADWCGIMCSGSCSEPDLLNFNLNIELRLDP
jgi:hypothetical protein